MIHGVLVGRCKAGNNIESRISGIPRRHGLVNWSKKLRFMVRLRGVVLAVLLQGELG